MPKYPSASSEGHSKLLVNIDFVFIRPGFAISVSEISPEARGGAQRWECGLLFNFYVEILI